MTTPSKSLQTTFKTLGRGLMALRTFMASPLARRLVLGLFVLQAVFLVFTVRIETPPDELNHIQFIQFYEHHSLSPIFTQQQPTYNLGDKTREPDYLYHYTMSLVARALPLSARAEIYAIRLFSVLFGLLSLLAIAKVLKLLGVTAGAITGALLLMSNLPMVLMLSSAVNNDALIWLGMALGLLLVIRLWQKPRTLDLLWLANLVVFGGLVKRTFLPLSMVFGLLGLLAFIRHTQVMMTGLRRFNWRIGMALVVLLLGIGLFSERVGGNIVRYHTIIPNCEQVQGQAACTGFWVNVRARHQAKLPPETPVPPVQFVARWFGESFENVVDIQAQLWRHEVKPARWLTPFLVTSLVIGLIYGAVYESQRFRTDQQARWRLYVLAVLLFFFAVQLAVNATEYHHKHVFGLALNGRYVLPALLPLIGFVWFYWSKLLGRHPKLQISYALIAVLSVILWSGLIMMLRNPQLRLG